MRSFLFLSFLSALFCCGCNQDVHETTVRGSDHDSASLGATPSRQVPTSSWQVQDPETNPIDGSKTHFLSLGSIEGDSESHYISGIGSIPVQKSTAKIVLCFRNGKLCAGSSIGARVGIDGFVPTDGSPVRLKYDDGQPLRQQWAGSDSHSSLFPYGREKQFVNSLLNHKTLYFEFSKYEEASQVVTFKIAGLADAMKQAGLTIPSDEKSRHDLDKSSQERAQKKAEQMTRIYCEQHPSNEYCQE